jgi:hypothetical protein
MLKEFLMSDMDIDRYNSIFEIIEYHRGNNLKEEIFIPKIILINYEVGDITISLEDIEEIEILMGGEF